MRLIRRLNMHQYLRHLRVLLEQMYLHFARNSMPGLDRNLRVDLKMQIDLIYISDAPHTKIVIRQRPRGLQHMLTQIFNHLPFRRRIQ